MQDTFSMYNKNTKHNESSTYPLSKIITIHEQASLPEINSNPSSNTKDCFKEFFGMKLKGVLFDALPINREVISKGNKTLIFEDGRGLTFSNSNGSFWIDSKEDIDFAISSEKEKYINARKDIEEILSLAGEVFEEEKTEFPENIEEEIKIVDKVIELCRIHSEKNGLSKGTIRCPRCGDWINYTISEGNGHCHGKCCAPGCLEWME